MFKKKTLTGFTPETKENLFLGAGVVFKNYDVVKDTIETAVAAKRLLGATKGGSTFVAKATMRQLEIDGLKTNTKGATIIDEYEVSLNTTLVEISDETIKMALVAVDEDVVTNEEYIVLKGREDVKDEDYYENITYIGTISGSDKPIIIQVFNALNQDGLSLKGENKGEAGITLTFAGNYGIEALDEPPFKIYYPKKKVIQ